MIRLIYGDTRSVLTKVTNNFTACLTDPPYGLGTMPMKWDSLIAWQFEFWRTVWHSLVPGAYCLVFSHPRVQHRITTQMEDSGFKIKDVLLWMYATGQTKSRNVSFHGEDGFGTALKPAYEPIIMAQKPRKGTVENNILRHSTGALNIDACRIPVETGDKKNSNDLRKNHSGFSSQYNPVPTDHTKGRFPANVMLCSNAAKLLDKQAAKIERDKGRYYYRYIPPSRMFYIPKVNGKELKQIKEYAKNGWAVKPMALMRYLVQMVSGPHSNLVLDPCCGTGTTLLACRDLGIPAVGIESNREQYEVALQRLENTPVFNQPISSRKKRRKTV